MPIHQINLFVCEKCGAMDTSCVDTILYDDPVVQKEGWGYRCETVDGKEVEMLLCPACVQDHV